MKSMRLDAAPARSEANCSERAAVVSCCFSYRRNVDRRCGRDLRICCAFPLAFRIAAATWWFTNRRNCTTTRLRTNGMRYMHSTGRVEESDHVVDTRTSAVHGKCARLPCGSIVHSPAYVL